MNVTDKIEQALKTLKNGGLIMMKGTSWAWASWSVLKM